jgi:small-conductance mechanosensitive channel
MSKKAKIIMAVVIVIILIALIVWYMMSKSDSNAEVTESTKVSSGLANLNLGGIFGGILAAKSGKPPVDYAEVAGTDGWAKMDF